LVWTAHRFTTLPPQSAFFSVSEQRKRPAYLFYLKSIGEEWYALVDDFRTFDFSLLARIPSEKELYGVQNPA
jgi:hypothetical protein